jgi:hypothetical protein
MSIDSASHRAFAAPHPPSADDDVRYFFATIGIYVAGRFITCILYYLPVAFFDF